MKRRFFISIFLMIMLITLPILSVLMVHHVTLSETLSCMDAGSFGQSSSLLTMDRDSDPETVFQAAMECHHDMALTADQKDTGADYKIRAIVFTGKYANLPMQWGRFFHNKDFQPDNYCAVIGKNLQKLVSYTEGEPYISASGKDYKVIGILGYEAATLMDDYIFINGLTLESDISNGIYSVDIFEKDSSNTAEDLSIALTNSGIQNVGEHAETESFENAFVPRLLYSRWFAVLLLCNIICLTLLTYEWVKVQTSEMCIRRLLGAPNKRVQNLLCLRYGRLLLPAALIGIGYCVICHPAYMRSLFVGYVIFFAIMVPFLLGSVSSILKKSIAEAIK